jgi:predicted aminopeptidase
VVLIAIFPEFSPLPQYTANAHAPVQARSRQRGGARRNVLWTTASLAALTAMLCVSGCANVGYYWQSVKGHVGVINAAKPVQDWLDDSQTPQATKLRLELSQRIRTFASSELQLPDNASYRRYADLQRSAAVWNVVAAPEYSLTLSTWCFAVVGCVSYRGFYNQADAQREAQLKQDEGLEVNVYGVPAYSTLGYLNWAGGDPLLSTFINYPEGELARLIFHELSHQVLYVQDDTMFNESFATAVERLGGALWLAQESTDAARAEYAQYDQRRKEFRALTLKARKNLAQIYAPPQLNRDVAAMKKIAMQEFKQDYEALKLQWGGYAGYDSWVAKANNASFGALAAYDELVPQFEALYAKQTGSPAQRFAAFYAQCKTLAAMPRDARRTALAAGTVAAN